MRSGAVARVETLEEGRAHAGTNGCVATPGGTSTVTLVDEWSLGARGRRSALVLRFPG